MLILTRKNEQTIQIAANMRITILQVKGNRVKIGIEAPESVRIRRSELIENLQAKEPAFADRWAG